MNGQAGRYVFYGEQVWSYHFTTDSITAGEAVGEAAVFVSETYGDAVDLVRGDLVRHRLFRLGDGLADDLSHGNRLGATLDGDEA